MGTLRENVRSFTMISRLILGKMRFFLDKSNGANQITHFTSSNFSPEIVPFKEIMWKNGNIIIRMGFSC